MNRLSNFSMLQNFSAAIAMDARIGPTHISLYMAFFLCWQRNGFNAPVIFKRKSIMQMAKIAGKATYHKCIRELHDYGYIRYTPCYKPGKGSGVYLDVSCQDIVRDSQ